MWVSTEDQERKSINDEFCTNSWMADLGENAVHFIMLTCPCNVDTLTPHVYIVMLGYTLFSDFDFKT